MLTLRRAVAALSLMFALMLAAIAGRCYVTSRSFVLLDAVTATGDGYSRYRSCLFIHPSGRMGVLRNTYIGPIAGVPEIDTEMGYMLEGWPLDNGVPNILINQGALWVPAMMVIACLICAALVLAFPASRSRTARTLVLSQVWCGLIALSAVWAMCPDRPMVMVGSSLGDQRFVSSGYQLSFNYHLDDPQDLLHRHEKILGPIQWVTMGEFAYVAIPSLTAPLLVVLLIAYPTFRDLRHWLSRPTADGPLCPSCNYDLRATPDRCPECGRVVAALASEAG